MANSYRDILLVGEDYIKTYTNIYDNLNGDYLLPSIYIAQHQFLEEILGTALVRKIQELVAENTIDNVENEKYKELLDDYITDYLTYCTICEMIVATSVKINNFGASRTDDEKQYGVSFTEIFQMQDYYKHKADYLQYRMQRFVIANYNYYPELLTYKTIADLMQNLYSAAGCNVWLGGARGKQTTIEKGEGYLKAKYNFPSKN